MLRPRFRSNPIYLQLGVLSALFYQQLLRRLHRIGEHFCIVDLPHKCLQLMRDVSRLRGKLFQRLQRDAILELELLNFIT